MKVSELTINILVWLALIMIVVIIGGLTSVLLFYKLALTLGVWMVYFYLNYLLLIPKLMVRRRMVFYIISIIGVSVLSFIALRNINVYYTEKILARQLEALDEYNDVKHSFEEKERLAWRMGADRRFGEHRGGEGRGERQADSASVSDSAKNDSLPTFTAREEAYARALRDYERARRFSREIRNARPAQYIFFNRSYLMTLLFLFLASLASAFIKRSIMADKRRSEVEQEKTLAELAYLKQQINPHFLFNTLNSIYSYTLGISSPATDAVLKLSSILRYMLYETNRERVPLSDELAIVYDYIDLQKLRLTDKTKVTIEINGDPAGHLIEPMLLVPILENAFKFGVDSFAESFIKIRLDIKGTEFVFNVKNKIVNPGSGDKNSSGIGIKNIRRRLDLIYGKSNYDLTTEDRYGIFYLSLRLNLKE